MSKLNALLKNIYSKLNKIGKNVINITEKNGYIIVEYNLKNKKKFNIKMDINDKGFIGEIGRLNFIIDLLNKGLNHKNIIIENITDIGSGSKRKRADLLIEISEIDKTENKKCYILVEIKTSISEFKIDKLNKFFQNQLYNIASALRKSKTNKYFPCYLMLVTANIKDNKIITNYFIESYYQLENIRKLTNKNIFVNIKNMNKSIDIKKGDIFINNKPLSYCDLKEVKADDFKNIITNEIHQKLRKKGFTEEKAFKIIHSILLTKIYDEIKNINNCEDFLEFQIFPRDYLNKQNFFNRINNLYQEARKFFFKEDAKKVKIYNLNIDTETLFEITSILQNIKIKVTKKLKDDILGTVFEELIHQTYKQSTGMFFTHPNITEFVCKCLGFNQKDIINKIKTSPLYICDPSCGSGTFLVEALKLLFSDEDYKNIKKKAEDVFYGIDINPDAVEITKINMAIHGDGSAKIYKENALAPLKDLKYIFKFLENNNILSYDENNFIKETIKGGGIDYIISNPPFSLEGLNNGEVEIFKIKDFLKSNNQSEFFFLERWYQLLNENGYIGVVLPMSIIDNKQNINAFFLTLCWFEPKAIILLPETTFSPFANQRTFLFFARKRKYEETEKLYNYFINYINSNSNKFLEEINKHKIFFSKISKIGYIRKKRGGNVITEHINENQLTDKLATEVYDFIYKSNLSNNNTKSILELINVGYDFKNDNNNSTIWNIVSIANYFNYQIIENKKTLIVETGDLHKKSGLILPKTTDSLSEGKQINLEKKIKNNKFINCLPGDIIIAPVRPYQQKISIITPTASKNFIFSKDFIVLRLKKIESLLKEKKIKKIDITLDKIIFKNDNQYFEFNLNYILKQAIAIYCSIIYPDNFNLIENSAKTGKSGYPKIKKEVLKNLPICLIDKKESEINYYLNIINNYDNIYKHFYKVL